MPRPDQLPGANRLASAKGGDSHCLIIGAMKCATTSLFAALSRSPGVNASRVKESNFFHDPSTLGGMWDHGPAWYEGLFTPRPGLRLEASTSYTKRLPNEVVVDRIFALLPAAKLIYLVRDPVHRSISHYLHNVIRGSELRPIHEALCNPLNNPYVQVSLYYLHLEEYLRKFSLDQIFVLPGERLWADPKRSMNEVAKFLRLEGDSGPPPSLPRSNGTAQKLSLISHNGPSSRAQEALLTGCVGAHIDSHANALVIGEALGFDKSDQRFLAGIFAPGVSALRDLLCDPIPEWKELF